MGRLGFFIQEAFRALRRNGAPSMAAIVTTIVTMVLLGVLIPIFQTTQGKSEEVRDQLVLKVFLYDDATSSEIRRPAPGRSTRSRTSSRSSSSPRRRR